MDNPLQITTCQAVNTAQFCHNLVDLLIRRGFSAHLEDRRSWQGRYQALYTGEIDIAWVCSWPAAQLTADPAADIELLAVPVMNGERYAQQAIYFSDVLVAETSPARSFGDLEGLTLAINYPDSHSGSRLVRHHLAQTGRRIDFFQKIIMTGGHLESLTAIQQGRAAAAAIDSTLFDWLAVHQPERLNGLRRLAVLGPSPTPPLVIHKRVPPEQRQAIRRLLLAMDHLPDGRPILNQALLHHVAPPDRFNGDLMWQMDRVIQGVDEFEIDIINY